MCPVFAFRGNVPHIDKGAFVAPTATLIGDVYVEEGASIWFGAVLRGDFGVIRIGRNSSVQDNCVVHSDPALPTTVGADVTVGHGAVLEGCVVEDGAVIGMSATVLHRARVGTGSMVAAGAVVGEGVEIPAHHLAAGVPARVKKPIEGPARGWVQEAALAYAELTRSYVDGRWFSGRDERVSSG